MLPKNVRPVLRALARAYPGADCALTRRNPLQLLVATMLSAQCTDKRVNLVTPGLFRRFREAEDYAASPPGEIETLIRSTGFFRSKARSIRSACAEIAARHGGKVPRTLEALTALRGVGRKTANVVLGNAFGIPGITVDTHVGRLSRRLGWTRHRDPEKVERALMRLWPRGEWTAISHRLIAHGRSCCKARKPDCAHCPVAHWCPSKRLAHPFRRG